MTDYREVYTHHADAYDALVSHEDHEQNLLRALRYIRPIEGLDAVETGAGTGRITLQLAPRVRTLSAFDASPQMLNIADQKLRAQGITNVHLGVAAHRNLPVPDGYADLAIEGWAFGHAVGWNPLGWREEVTLYLRELKRVLRAGGTTVLIETMGTGVEAPFEGGHALEPLHKLWVHEMGFNHRCIRTDYAFETVDEAAEKMAFFFGEKMAARIRARGWRVVPECTGIYWR